MLGLIFSLPLPAPNLPDSKHTDIVSGTVMAGKYQTSGETSKATFPLSSNYLLRNILGWVTRGSRRARTFFVNPAA